MARSIEGAIHCLRSTFTDISRYLSVAGRGEERGDNCLTFQNGSVIDWYKLWQSRAFQLKLSDV